MVRQQLGRQEFREPRNEDEREKEIRALVR